MRFERIREQHALAAQLLPDLEIAGDAGPPDFVLDRTTFGRSAARTSTPAG
jgi:hypothetical protein